MKKQTKILALILTMGMAQQIVAESSAQASTFKQFCKKGVFALLPESAQKYRTPVLTILACGAVAKLVKDWPEIKDSYASIKRRLARKKYRAKMAKLTLNRENAIYEVPFFKREQDDKAPNRNMFLRFYDQISHEKLIFEADEYGLVRYVILFDAGNNLLKMAYIKTDTLKLENIAGAGCLGNYLKIAFAPNEIIGCFDGFEDGNTMEL